MKKLVLVFVTIALFCVTLFGMTVVSYADEVDPAGQTEIVESENEITKIKNWIVENVNKETINNIIHYVIESGFGIGLITTLIKYYKERRATKEIIEEITTSVVNEILKEKDEKEKQEILKNINELKETTSTIIKALAFMQDTTSKGKIALLDLLKIDKSSDVQESIEKTKEVIEEQIKTDNEVKKLVDEEYKEIF